MTLLQGHEFIAPAPSITVNGTSIANSGTYEAQDGIATINCTMNEGAMIKSHTFVAENVTGATVNKNGDTLTVTKTAATATMTIKFTAVDDYDREYEQTYNITITDVIVPITDVTFTVDGEEFTGSEYTESGYPLRFEGFDGVQLGYIISPTNASAPKSVEWSISDSTYMTVSDEGFVNLTSRGKGIARTSNSELITCTIVDASNNTITKTIRVTISR